MDREKFIETEKIYNQLKEKLDNRLITPDQMKKELKKMMVLDEQGQYWMIGGKTGRWYVYNGSDWKEATPFKESTPPTPIPAATNHKHTAILGTDLGTVVEDTFTLSHEEEYAGGGTGTREISFNGDEVHSEPLQQSQPSSQKHPFLSDAPRDSASRDSSSRDDASSSRRPPLTHQESQYQTKPVTRERETVAETQTHTESTVQDNTLRTDGPRINCCACQSKIPSYALYCNLCGANQKEVPKINSKSKKKKVWDHQGEMLITSVRITSAVFFLGGLGLVVGVLLGAGFGIFKDFFVLSAHYSLPQMLEDTRGGIAGGLVFAAIGGIGGFISSAVAAAILSGIYNTISYFFGGLRLNIKQ